MNTPPRVQRQSATGRVEFRAHPGGAAFYTSVDGTRWRIYDCIYANGALERVYLEADTATHRIFADGESGRRLVYRRRKYEVYKLSPETCVRQLGAAKPLEEGSVATDDEVAEE